MRILILLVILTQIGCQSEPKEKPDHLPIQEYDGNSKADGHAYYGEAMMIRTPMTNSAKDEKPVRFFFKDCMQSDPKFYYSKTAYDCTYP